MRNRFQHEHMQCPLGVHLRASHSPSLEVGVLGDSVAGAELGGGCIPPVASRLPMSHWLNIIKIKKVMTVNR
jgi:hypothetical protein